MEAIGIDTNLYGVEYVKPKEEGQKKRNRYKWGCVGLKEALLCNDVNIQAHIDNKTQAGQEWSRFVKECQIEAK